jgi:hypothetical protein
MPSVASWVPEQHCNNSSIEKRVRDGMKSWKAHLLSSAEQQEAISGLEFINKWGTATLQQDIEFANSKWHPERDIFECIIMAWRFVFQRWWLWYSETGNQDLSNGTKFAS